MSSNSTSPPETDEKREIRLLFASLQAKNHSFSPSPRFGRDLKGYSPALRTESWKRIHEFYKQYVLRQTPQINLHIERVEVRAGKTEAMQTIWLNRANRIGLDWHKGVLYVRRVGPHSGSRKIHRRSSS